MAHAEDAPFALCGGRIGRWPRSYDAFRPDAAVAQAALPYSRRRRVRVARGRSPDLRACRAVSLCRVRCAVVRCYVILINCIARASGFGGACAIGGNAVIGGIGRASCFAGQRGSRGIGRASCCAGQRGVRGIRRESCCADQRGIGGISRASCCAGQRGISGILRVHRIAGVRSIARIGRVRHAGERSRGSRADAAAPAPAAVGR